MPEDDGASVMPRATMQKWDEAREARLADPTNPALIDAEYEAEREHFAKVREEERAQAEAKLKSERYKRQALTLIIIFAIAAGIFATTKLVVKVQNTADEAKAVSTRVHRLTVENADLTTGLQAALVESCQKNTNERVKVNREELEEEIYETEHPDQEAFKALVESGISPEAIENSEAKERVKLEGRLDRIHLTKCASQYHLGPDHAAR